MLKRGIIALLVVACLASFVGCGTTMSYEFGPISGGPASTDAVNGNGNFVVSKGDYIYYINSFEETTTKNILGSSYAGAIMRSKADGSDVEAIFPKLVTSKSDNGLTIIGDRIYFTSPSDSVDSAGNTQAYYLDIMSVKLDGTDAKKHSTLGSTEVAVKFVEDGAVYAVFTQNGALYSIDLSESKPEKQEVVSGHTTMVIDGNNIYYTKAAVIDEENGINDTYDELYVQTVNGTPTKLHDGNKSDLIQYEIALVGMTEGSLYFTKSDSLVSLESSLYCITADNKVEKVSSFPATQAYAYGNGYLYSSSNNGTVLSVDGKLFQLSPSPVDIVGIVNGTLIYKSVASEKGKLFTLDLTKVAAGTEVKAVQLLEYTTTSTDAETEEEVTKTVYDEFNSKYFADAVVYGDYIYYYSAVKHSRDLVSYNMKTKEFKVISADIVFDAE